MYTIRMVYYRVLTYVDMYADMHVYIRIYIHICFTASVIYVDCVVGCIYIRIIILHMYDYVAAHKVLYT